MRIHVIMMKRNILIMRRESEMARCAGTMFLGNGDEVVRENKTEGPRMEGGGASREDVGPGNQE